MRVFVSYAEYDEDFARDILSILRNRNMHPVSGNAFFIDYRWREALKNSSVLLFILSYAAMQSARCQEQWRYAMNLNRRVIILRLDAVPMSEEMRNHNLVDYLDFIDIGRQISEGIPGLQRDRYAVEVTLKMLIAELAMVQRAEEEQAHNGYMEDEDTAETGISGVFPKDKDEQQSSRGILSRLLRRRSKNSEEG